MAEPEVARDNAVRLQILGPLRIWRGDAEVDPGPRQQACLLAMLLALEGRPISRPELIDLIWETEPPASALNVIHKYVGALRRLLEPGLSARGPGSYLRPRGDGYVFVAGPGDLDLVEFRQLVQAAQAAAARARPEEALDRYADALALWHGPAGDGLAYGSAATPIFVALEAEFAGACVAAAGLAVELGRPDRVLPALRLAGSMAPLSEPVQASLVLALGAAGQQAEALSVFRAARARLAGELGVESGPELQAAQLRVLTQSLSATVPDAADEVAAGLVGRGDELAMLRADLASALAGGTGLVVVEGQPGAGKTSLVAEAVAEAERSGALVVWGVCLDGVGAPSMWPWVKAVGAILGALPPEVRLHALDGDLGRLAESEVGPRGTSPLPDSGARFRLFEQVVAVVGHSARQRPTIVVIDDLQWADLASLEMLGHLAARLPDGAAVIGILRDRAPARGTDLSRTLAGMSRVPGHRRIPLGPLSPAEVATLVHRATGRAPSAAVVHNIHARTAGNAFFVQELSRLLADSGVLDENAATDARVPSTVRDIVRFRTEDLAGDDQRLLRTAALIGRQVHLGLLAHAAGLDIPACLRRIEPLEGLGILAPVPGDPYTFRFAHDLVRESVAAITPSRQATEIHLRVASAIEAGPAGEESAAERLAHHLWQAAPLADPARTARALIGAGRSAAAKAGFEDAERHLRSAVRLARMAGRPELELSALSVLAVVYNRHAVFSDSFTDLLDRSEHLARGLGREAEAATFLFLRLITASWSMRARESARLARRLLDLGNASPDPTVRAYGRQAWALHRWDLGHVGEAVRSMCSGEPAMLGHRVLDEENPLQRDLRMFGAATRAMMTAASGDLGSARALLDTVRGTAGQDRLAIAVWAHFTTLSAALAGEWKWALPALEQWSVADPWHRIVSVDPMLRLVRCWMRAMAGDDPAGAAFEAEEIVVASLSDPPWSGVAFYCGLVAEMFLAAGLPDEAGKTLDRAEEFLERWGQRFAEGRLLLVRARVMRARGEPAEAVRAAAETARTVSIQCGALAFARQAGDFLAENLG